MLSSPDIQHAISAIKLRAERQEFDAHLLTTFVDPGITARVANDNNQIIYGRRGTGKTHLLHVLRRVFAQKTGTLPVLIDLDRLGDSRVVDRKAQRPAAKRVTDLFRDVLLVLHAELLDYATLPSTDIAEDANRDLDAFAEAITGAIMQPQAISISDQMTTSRTESDTASMRLSFSPELSVGGATSAANADQSRVAMKADLLDQILFGDLTNTLDRVLDAMGLKRLVLLIDEWPSVAWDTQPLLAEFVRRCFSKNPRVTVKIASIEYRSNFFELLPHNAVLGFELGSDITPALELDDLFVFDRNNDQALAAFAELVYRHLAAELEVDAYFEQFGDPPATERRAVVTEILRRLQTPDRYLNRVHGVMNADELTFALFAGPRVFRELVRAAEGVARDFISVAADA
jgi:hypothetical protein